MPFPASFSLFLSLKHKFNTVNKKFIAWIRTTDIWCQKWLLHQQIQNHCPYIHVFFKKNVPFPASFSLFLSLQHKFNTVNKKFDAWIWTMDIWCQKWPLHQLSQNHCQYSHVFLKKCAIPGLFFLIFVFTTQI